MAGSLWIDLQVLYAFFGTFFGGKSIVCWTLAEQINGHANLSLCHVLPYGNIICKYFYVWYVTRDWAAHVKQRHYRIGLFQCWGEYDKFPDGEGNTCQCVKKNMAHSRFHSWVRLFYCGDKIK